MNFDIHFIHECQSTNEEAKNLSAGSVIYAQKQTNGKGRMGRKWYDGDGNLMASIVLKKEPNAHLYSFLISLAVAQSIAFLSPRIKWPNDILVEGKKICGILLETTEDTLIIGMGVNIQSHPTDELLYKATDLKEYGRAVKAEKLLQDILQNLSFMIELYHQKGFEQIRLKWLNFACGLGKEISVRLPRMTLTGKFEGIDENGTLLLTDEQGQKHSITAGDVFMIE
jgi:BirA family biotin operon repressor/biotin-[acetyl-CoA-carboxylase] ligase